MRKEQLLMLIISLNLLFSFVPISLAQMQPHENTKTNQFQKIEQPLSLKFIISAGGLALIGLELWWFLFNHTKPQKANNKQDIQEIDIIVDAGYIPNKILVQAGKLVRLNFVRKDPNSCLDEVLLPDFQKTADLKLNQTTSVEFIPQKPGQYPFHCGMNMFRGVIEVQ